MKQEKIIISKLIFGIAILFLLLFPFHLLGVNFPIFFYKNILIDARFIIAGFFFLIFSILSFIYFINLKKKDNKINIFGKVVTSIFVDVILIYFAASGHISYFIPVSIVCYDLFILIVIILLLYNGKEFSYKMPDKVKNFAILLGVLLSLFYNLPFELFSLKIADACLYFASFMAILSGFDAYFSHKKDLKIFLKSEN